jgi:hypothetical protein
VFGALMAMLVIWGGTAAAKGGNQTPAPMSGARDFDDVELGSNITECPQAGIDNQSLRRTERDQVERLSERGNDIRLNQDYACLPQDEMSIFVNPLDRNNIVGGANDYRLGWGSSGFYSTTSRFGGDEHGHDGRMNHDDNEGGSGIYDGIRAFPTIPGGPDHLDGGGDPAIVFDREGTVYYADIHFNRDDDTNGIFVSRSTNGGYTWSRPCVPVAGNDQTAVCGGLGDTRFPGDGRISFWQDADHIANGSVPFDDKEYIAAGRRPSGVSPVCYLPITRTPTTCDPALVGPDRVYVTWTRFDVDGTSKIYVSTSDDRGRSWSEGRAISGSAAFCVGIIGATDCDANQYSNPKVQPTTGHVWVSFENFNTPDENQYVVVRSNDGGQTWTGPLFITPVFDVNYPRSGGAGGRPDCTPRGQQGGRRVLTNSCFRLNAGGPLVVDKRGGAFADDLYQFIADNRNGTRISTNTDVTMYKSTNGGLTWAGPTRVNDDPSSQPAARSCGRTGDPPCPPGVPTYGNDQFYPWAEMSDRGWLNAAWQDRRLDMTSPVGGGEWPTSKTRLGNYLLWYWGGNCRVNQTGPIDQSSGRQCVAPTAGIITQPTEPINPDDSPFPNQTVFPFDNFGISDTPYNWDYCFRAGIFCGDYEGLAIGPDNKVWAMWTDARNGRSSRTQAGRNPICEQSDAWADTYSDNGHASGQNSPRSSDQLYWQTNCPIDD